MNNRKVSESVVVVTGASSGIGKATALMLAERGATLVLCARRHDALEEVRAACEERGARAITYAADVKDEQAMHAMARYAVENVGRIDVWVNNAAVTLFGKVEETPIEDYRQVIETNLFGYLYGTRAVLPYFREQGHGTLIFMDSVVGAAPQPYTSAYVISKSGIRALANCLRMELHLDDARDIHVCNIMPATIDTPFFQNAANYTGREVKAMEPVYPPEKVAKAVIQMIERPKREMIVGNAGRMMAGQHEIAPGLWETMGAKQVDSSHLKDDPAEPSTGNIYAPSGYTSVRGGWRVEEGPSFGKFAIAGVAAAAATAAVVFSRR